LTKSDFTKAGTTRGQKLVFGKLLWLSVTTVVFLTENMRQTGPENAAFVELLGRLREGRCTSADYELLNTRLASRLNLDWDSDPWSSAPVIVAENAMKDALNLQMAHDFAAKTGQPLHWYYAQDTHSRSTPVTSPELKDKLMQMDSGKTSSRLGRIPLVIGMPVMISQNFDVPGGVINGCTGKLVSVRYQLGPDGKRYATSCIVDAPDTTSGILPDLPNHHVVSLRDTVNLSFMHPHSKATVTVKRTQLPIVPAFAITAHKAQGKTLTACVVNFTGCRGTESPYVMVSRATSLEGLVILTPFPKNKICCRQNEDIRAEFRRLKYLALKTTLMHGTKEEAAYAAKEICASFSAPSNAPSSEVDTAVPSDSEDVYMRLDRLQRSNAVLSAEPTIRPGRVPINTPRPQPPSTAAAGPSQGHLVFLPPISRPPVTRKRRLDDTSPPKVTKKRRVA
jgi:hypothetical protein